jgi:hypothetical protein
MVAPPQVANRYALLLLKNKVWRDLASAARLSIQDITVM